MRLIFLAIAVVSLFIGLGEIFFELNLQFMDSAVPVPALALVDERKLLLYKIALTAGGIILFLFMAKLGKKPLVKS